jgi:hypothetical protein
MGMCISGDREGRYGSTEYDKRVQVFTEADEADVSGGKRGCAERTESRPPQLAREPSVGTDVSHVQLAWQDC